MNKIAAASAILKGIGAPLNQHTLGAMIGWFNAEGGNWNNSASFNPLNTTQGAPGARSINSVGVKAYQNWNQGIQATIQTLKNGHYGQILQAFHNSDPQGVVHAIGSSPWGTSAATVASTIGAATGQHYSIHEPTAMAAAGQRAAGLGPSSMTIPAVQQPDFKTAIASYLLNSNNRIDTSGKVQTTGGGLLNAIQNAQLQTTSPAQTIHFPAASQRAAQRAAAGVGGDHGKDVNPLMHFTIGRTDMGVDANARPGTPILAPNKARVVGILPNWYAGQPYVALKLLSGPNAGKVMYVAEQITGVPRVGQVIQRGQPIAHYASSGTGIEIGWASPSNWAQTLAQATTGYSEGQVTKAGGAFRNYLGSLGAR